ncbi:MAG TPA: alpha-1,4-glucan--maltose-1-phosphate maltosyltransferase [Candidatus Angelobacter sp.]|nr:alpha-1,4-glucan--maltose-1-phosphate maltosyltransferase [Candidatus Angelobacter sp.]
MVSKTQESRAPLRLTRVVIENVRPEVDCGQFAIKRVVGEQVEVTADIHADGHDVVFAVLRYRSPSQAEWQEIKMESLVNDSWKAAFPVSEQGRYLYTVTAWTDRFASWHRDLGKKFSAGQDIALDILVGKDLITQAAGRASGPDAKRLLSWAEELAMSGEKEPRLGVEAAENPELIQLMQSHADRSNASTYPRELAVTVDREKARFSAWYEIFPRSCGPNGGVHGTFRDCESKLPYIAEMGFDVLYLPPIHPIGVTNRKGKNNSEVCSKDDVGSPWAIGSHEGGHDAIHPQLGTLADFKRLRSKAEQLGLEMALDLAFQCTPDHPYVKEHKNWFRVLPDGSVQYAENPPKKYQDIYPLDFETQSVNELFEELKRVTLYWIEQGIRIFRVDNPHTKPYQFWEWLIAEIKSQYPDVLFLSEAFTRPKVMYRLAKLGFTQSYTYFAWRNTKYELTEYFTELTRTPVREYFRPNLWPNTPDILTEFLQFGERPAFMIRFVLAATLGASYGIYGPAFELCENRALRAGSEEYLDSEKYQLRQWNTADARSLKDLIARVNRIRKENLALQSDWSLQFHPNDNEQLLVYSKTSPDFSSVIVVVVNLDRYYTQSGWVDLRLDALGLDPAQPYQMHDLLDDSRYLWHGAHNYVKLDPHTMPAHIFRVRRRVRTERDFDYFL